ncbi:DUF6414 family protein [Rhodococcus sp. IEGM1428]|uniref:DUF6414 family protein n=1 Tax=Rhodococcus sp. IEGM1428 TaxID=3392191 RepID=UPI003D0B108E
MLRDFLYLNEAAVGRYVSALEGGSRQSLERTQGKQRSGSGGIGVGPVKVSGSRGSDFGETESLADTPEAQFDRLYKFGRQNPEDAMWEEILDVETSMDTVGVGAIVEVESDLFFPDLVRGMMKKGGLVDGLNALESMLPFIDTLGIAELPADLPGADQRNALKGMIESLSGDMTVVGEFDDSDWKLTGKLQPDYLRQDIDGPARIVGKVAGRLQPGKWLPVMTIPGAMANRKSRRQQRSEVPTPGQEDNYVKGPALRLDVIAIFR